ncbi:MAG: PorT family protein [Saprospiraceae bacterium]|nr:PorT family protein [Saprospiraceae bacterium]
MIKPLFTLVFCLFVLSAFAQKDDDKHRPNGIRIGYQNSLYSDGDNTSDALSRGYFGFMRKIGKRDLFHLETGLEYMMAGAKFENDAQVQLHYITLPLQGVVKIGPFVGLAGINGNFRIGENYKVGDQEIERNDDNKSNGFDVAVDAGLGFNILFMTIEARYYWGLIEVENDLYNRYVQAGLKFHF